MPCTLSGYLFDTQKGHIVSDPDVQSFKRGRQANQVTEGNVDTLFVAINLFPKEIHVLWQFILQHDEFVGLHFFRASIFNNIHANYCQVRENGIRECRKYVLHEYSYPSGWKVLSLICSAYLTRQRLSSF